MRCQEAEQILDCRVHSDGTASIMVPVLLPGGSPVHAFVKNEGNAVEISDLGDTVACANALGVGFRQRFVHGLQARIEQAGAVLIDGEITATASSFLHAYATFVKASVYAEQYINERMAPNEDDDVLVETVLSQLEKRNPGIKLEKNVKVLGASGQEHIFPIRAESRLIYPLHPNGHSTGSALRRIVDVENAGELAPIVVLDDSETRNKARQEAQIIGAVAKTMLLSELTHGTGPLNLAA